MPEGKSIQMSVKSTTKLIKLQAVICHRDIRVIIKLGIVMAVTKCRYDFCWKTILYSKSPFILVNTLFPHTVLFTPMYHKNCKIDMKNIREPYAAEDMLTYMLFRIPQNALKFQTNRRGATTLNSKGRDH